MCASALAACSASTPSDRVAITVSDLRAAIVTGCPALAALPAGEKTRAEVERLWARDRAALGKCGVMFRGLVDLVERQNRGLEASGRD